MQDHVEGFEWFVLQNREQRRWVFGENVMFPTEEGSVAIELCKDNGGETSGP